MSRDVLEWRAIARGHFETLLDGVAAASDARQNEVAQTAREEARQESRSQFAESLNQGLRRLRQVSSVSDCAALAVELAAPFASASAVFLFRDGQAYASAMNGLGALPLSFSPGDAAAFRAAIDSGDPVIAAGTQSEISPQLAERIGEESVERVYLFPMQVRGATHAVLFTARTEQAAALELIAGLAAMQMEAFTALPTPRRDDLIHIAESPFQPTAGSSSTAWVDLTPELQAMHLRAQRQARLLVAEIRLQHGGALLRGIERSNIFDALRQPMELAREAFRRDFIQASPTMVDYLYLEFVRGLAREDDRLLGPTFPGPLV